MNVRVDIERDRRRLEEDDWKLNVQPRLDGSNESVSVYDHNLQLIGWKIQGKYE